MLVYWLQIGTNCLTSVVSCLVVRFTCVCVLVHRQSTKVSIASLSLASLAGRLIQLAQYMRNEHWRKKEEDKSECCCTNWLHFCSGLGGSGDGSSGD